MSDSCHKNTNFFFSQEREPFNGVFFWKETLLCSQDDIHLRKELWVLSKDKDSYEKNLIYVWFLLEEY